MNLKQLKYLLMVLQIELSEALNPEKDNFQKLFDLNFMVTFRLSQIITKNDNPKTNE